ncbi:hypothetical protein [Streptomyces zaomyceticus]|uniref:hypothetical protein n=1 Tax=Streptomyces zaomyceticus TaxID=68286 RepID=UPI0033BAA1C6
MVADRYEKGGKAGRSLLGERDGLMEAMEWITGARAAGILAPNLDRLARELCPGGRARSLLTASQAAPWVTT